MARAMSMKDHQASSPLTLARAQNQWEAGPPGPPGPPEDQRAGRSLICGASYTVRRPNARLLARIAFFRKRKE